MSQIGNAILFRNRYRNLYLLSTTLESSGSVIRIAGGLVGMLMPIASAWFFAHPSRPGHPVAWRILATGLIAGVAGYLLGLVCVAIGHLLRAAADTAVSASPLISPEMKTLLLSRALEKNNKSGFRLDPGAIQSGPAPTPPGHASPSMRLELQPRRLPASTKPAA